MNVPNVRHLLVANYLAVHGTCSDRDICTAMGWGSCGASASLRWLLEHHLIRAGGRVQRKAGVRGAQGWLLTPAGRALVDERPFDVSKPRGGRKTPAPAQPRVRLPGKAPVRSIFELAAAL